MPDIRYKDRVKDTTSTTGTGALTLSGTAPTGFVDFNSAFGTNVYFYYALAGSSDAEWEVGVGYLSGATTLVRETVLGSSNSGALVSLTGAKDVFCTISASFAQKLIGRGVSILLGRGNFLQ